MSAALAEEEEAETIPPGTMLASRYKVVRRLGSGGMGSVWLVQHVHTDQELAVKILHTAVVQDAQTLERFRREARAPARIQSDHVVHVTDADVAPEIGGVPFLVMERLRGEDLSQVLEKRGSLPPAEVVLYLRQAARALDKAHGLGIIHRDLKPENLFLTTREDGTPLIKLLDFGIAKLTGASGDLARMGSATTTGQIFGTPMFMSPEQAKAETDKISPQTDVWALGLIAHKMLTGKDAWEAQTLTHLIALIAYEPIKAPSERGVAFGAGYDAWFLRCCDRDPPARFATAGDTVTALADALGVTETSPASTEIPSSGQSPPTKRSGATGTSRPLELAATAHVADGRDTTVDPPRAQRPPVWKLALFGIAVAAVVAVGVAALRSESGNVASSSAASADPKTAVDPPRAPPTATTGPTVDVEPAHTVTPVTPGGSTTADPAKTRGTSAGKAPVSPPRPTPSTTPVAPPPKGDDDPLSGRH